MHQAQEYSLDAVRTDGWFERIGQGIGSFRVLCDVVGEQFFAFSIITGARITALTVDRRNPDETVVDFVVGGQGDELEAVSQRLALPDFRKRLVAALLVQGPTGPAPERDTDTEALQLHIGVRYLLLAPLFGYSLRTLRREQGRSTLRMLVDGQEETVELELFQQRLLGHVREELTRAMSPRRSTIDLANVETAQEAFEKGDWIAVVQLMGAWPAPLSIYLRTPEGQRMLPQTSTLIAKGLGLLAMAWVQLGEMARAEEVFRLGVQYGQDGAVSAEIFFQFGAALIADGRAGQAIGLLRRALALDVDPARVYPLLARAFRLRHRYVAARGCWLMALQSGVPLDEVEDELSLVNTALGSKIDLVPVGLIADPSDCDRPKAQAEPTQPCPNDLSRDNLPM